MKPEEWLQIEQFYLDALERPPEQRPAFLAAACADNQAIRREVESLLANEGEMKQFLETPPGIFAERVLARKEHAPSMVGCMLGHYRVQSLLGVGGMGEIYLARDLNLDRQVAIKLLPAKFTQDPERLRRFVREARAASALNHPNILTIYEIGEIGDTHFIATEFVEGETLRERRARQSLTLRETLGVAIQIASALDAAHKTGIVHRDIKLENLMLRPDGLVKVLDFGLAKLTENWERQRDRETEGWRDRGTEGQRDGETLSRPLSVSPSLPLSLSTEPGMVMGTPRYMSPEQVRGQKVDARSDIFSLGVVLYEMIAGRPPFDGETANDVIAAVLKTDPLPLKRYWPQVPGELEMIVTKALCKDREIRYQTVRELQLDLAEFKEKLDFEARLAGAHREEAGSGSSLNNDTMREPVVRTVEIVAPNTSQTAEYRSGSAQPAWRGRRGVLTALAAFIAIATGLVLGWRQLTGPPSGPASLQASNISKLTNTGRAVCASISPDGKYLVYALGEAGQQSLRFKQVATGSEREIILPAEVSYRGITFSPDGNFIYYVRMEPEGVLYRATVFGDEVRKLLDRVHSAITFSPKSRRFAFVRHDSAAAEYVLMIANEDGSGEKRLAARKSPAAFRMVGPAWSPDDRFIACGVENDTGGLRQSVVGVDVETGAEEPLTSQTWEIVHQVAWLPDGSGLLMVAVEQRATLRQIWHLPHPIGEARQVVRDLSNYSHVSLTTDSRSLAAVRSDRFVNLWVTPGKDAAVARQITRGTQNEDGWRGLAWMPDGRIVYRSLAGGNGNPNIRIVGADGLGDKALSADANQNLDPTVSPDGRYITWSASRTRYRNIWRMDLDGSNPRQITQGNGEWYPQYTPDGKWLIYQAQGTGNSDRLLFKMPLDGGAPIQLTDKSSYAPTLSPDGKLIACNYRSEANAPIKMAVISVDGGAPLKLFDPPGSFNPGAKLDHHRPLRWTPDGRELAFIVTRGEVSNLWSQPLAGGPPKKLTHFTDYGIFNFAWSRDGRQLALSRGADNNDVVLISISK